MRNIALRPIWFSLVAATLLFSMLGVRGLFDPVRSSAVHEIILGSNAGVTVARVAFGGLPLALALIFVGCLVSEERVLAGLSVLVTVAVVLTAARLLGVVLDGPAPFTMHVLKPEIGLVVASATALALERWRRRTPRDDQAAAVHRLQAREGSS
ncbi:MAG TPA: hypothetical protein VKU41_18435 [Polyangiaceae bacterium]|nr:hypothetical protein [Polyangiaceae bacterium]